MPVLPLLLVWLRALGLVGHALVLGGAVFGLAVLRPWLTAEPAMVPAARRVLRLARAGALLVVGAQAAGLLLIASSVADAPGWSLDIFVETPLAVSSALRAAAAVAALALAAWVERAPAARGRWLALAVAGGAAALAAAGSSHAAGRLDGRLWLLAADAVHQVAVAVWIGGLAHLTVVALAHGARPWPPAVLRGFSRVARVAVIVLAASGVALAARLVGGPAALIGTAYGGMLLAKTALFGALLGLGAANLRAVRGLDDAPVVPPSRLRRFVEVEAGLGLTLLFVGASLGSAPPAVDVVAERATLGEVLSRFTPRWPTLSTPSMAELAQASAVDDPLAPRTPADTAWSEYNHNVAGLFVLAIGVLAALHRLGGRTWARHWPLVLIALSLFILLRSDPNAWPLSPTRGVLDGLTDAEIVQHRLLALLPAALGLIEWLVQTGRLRGARWTGAIALLIAVGGGLLLAHAHPLVRVKESYLMEVTHLPLGLLAVLIGWARWLELRLPSGDGGLAGRVWPPAVALIGLLLVLYREG
jgi:putative copper resistance protein D